MSGRVWVLVPGSPVLLPEVGGRADPGARLRRLCRAEIAAALPDPDGEVTVMAAGDRDRSWPGDAPYPLERLRGGAVTTDPDRLPLTLAVGRSLVRATGWTGPISLRTVGSTEGGAQGAQEGTQRTEGTTVLVGDGSLLRHEKGGPGPRHPGGEGFDEQVRAAVAAGDAPALASLDPRLAAELGVTGLPVWRLLSREVGDRPVQASVSFAGDPFGPYALVACWRQP